MIEILTHPQFLYGLRFGLGMYVVYLFHLVFLHATKKEKVLMEPTKYDFVLAVSALETTVNALSEIAKDNGPLGTKAGATLYAVDCTFGEVVELKRKLR